MEWLPLLVALALVPSIWACRNSWPDQGAGKNGDVKRWGVHVGDRVQSTPALARDGSVIVGSSDQHLYSFFPNGKRRWRVKLKGVVLSPAIDSKDRIYVTTGAGVIAAVDSDGSLKWRHTLKRKLFGCPPAILKSGRILVGGSFVLFAFDRHGIRPKDAPKKLPLIYSCPVSDPKRKLFYVSDKKRLYAIGEDGKRVWSYQTGGPVQGPSFDKDGNLYVGTGDGRLLSLKPGGRLRWEFRAPKAVHPDNPKIPTGFGVPVVTRAGRLVVSRVGVGVYSFGRGRKLKWVYRTKKDVYRDVVVHPSGNIYFTAADGALHAVLPNGKLKYKFVTLDRIYRGVRLAADGKALYFGSMDKHFYSLTP